MLINVDLDGVLIPNYFEKQLVEKGMQSGGLPSKISQFDGRTFDWYVEMVTTSPNAPLNIPLLHTLHQWRMSGNAIRLWTNRNLELKKKTIQNLGDWYGLFDSFHFFSGKKHESRVDGIVIDNSLKYLNCGEMGIHYEWR